MGDEKVVFNLSNIVKKPTYFPTCNLIQARDPIDALLESSFSSVGVEDPLERVLTAEEEILMFSSKLRVMVSQ